MKPLMGTYCSVTDKLLEFEQLPYPYSTEVEMLPHPSASTTQTYGLSFLGGSSFNAFDAPKPPKILEPPEKRCTCHRKPVIIRELS